MAYVRTECTHSFDNLVKIKPPLMFPTSASQPHTQVCLPLTGKAEWPEKAAPGQFTRKKCSSSGYMFGSSQGVAS